MIIDLQYFGGRGASSGRRNGIKGRKRKLRGQQLHGERRKRRRGRRGNKYDSDKVLKKDSYFTKLNAGSTAKSIAEFRKHTNGLDYEIGGFLDKTGKAFHMVQGNHGSVDVIVGLTRSRIAKMKGGTLIHNHPNANIFSDDDLQAFSEFNKAAGLKSIVATGGKVARRERQIMNRSIHNDVQPKVKRKEWVEFNKYESQTGYILTATKSFRADDFNDAISRGRHVRNKRSDETGETGAIHRWLSSSKVQKKYGFKYREL